MNDYAKGFKDGWHAGLEEGKKIAPKEQTYNPWIDTGPYVGKANESCPKCGVKIGGVMGYVCSSPNCPTFPQVTCEVGRPLTGAVGAVNTNASSVVDGGWDGKGPRHGWYDHHGKWQPDRGR
jgi:hypothetical protein